MQNDDLNRTQTAGLILGTLAVVFCSMEMVPGWGIFGFEWETWVYYAIVAGCGFVGGALAGVPRIFAAICGAIAACGALYATSLVLDNFNRVPKIALVLAGLAGAAPGVILFNVIKKIVSPPQPSPADWAKDEETHIPEPPHAP